MRNVVNGATVLICTHFHTGQADGGGRSSRPLTRLKLIFREFPEEKTPAFSNLYLQLSAGFIRSPRALPCETALKIPSVSGFNDKTAFYRGARYGLTQSIFAPLGGILANANAYLSNPASMWSHLSDSN